MNQKPLELRKIRDFGQCISDAFLFVKQNFKPLVGSTLAICCIFLLLEVFASYFQQSQQFKIMSGTNSMGYSRTVSIFTTSYFLYLFATLLAYTVILCSVNAYVAVYLENPDKKPTLAEVWGFLTYYFWRVLGGAFLGNCLIVVGMVLCLVPGIWLAPIMSLIVPIIVMENGTLGYAFNRSFKLIEGNWWSTVGVIFVAFIIVIIPGYIVGAIIGIIGGASVYFTTGGEWEKTLSVALAIVQAVIQILYIFPAIAIIFCYFSLVEEKESVGMMGRIENFGAQKEQDNSRYDSDFEELY